MIRYHGFEENIPYHYDTDVHFAQVREFAEAFGIDPKCVDILAQNGFTADEIEDLLYEPDELMNYDDMLAYEGYYF